MTLLLRMQKNGVLWSVREDPDGLLKCLGLRELPELAGEERSDHTK